MQPLSNKEMLDTSGGMLWGGLIISIAAYYIAKQVVNTIINSHKINIGR